MANYAIKGPH